MISKPRPFKQNRMECVYIGAPFLLQNLNINRLCVIVVARVGEGRQRQRSGAAKRQQRDVHGYRD